MRLPSDLYRVNQNGSITCLLCPKTCTLQPEKAGDCGNRKAVINDQGELVPIFRQVDRIEAVNLDPIEKKPLYHFQPGGNVLSLGLSGCNMTCYYCQNHALSQDLKPKTFISPEMTESLEQEVTANVITQLERAEQRTSSENIIGVSFTYSEPITWFEFIYPIADQVKNKGYYNTIVSNGMMTSTTADKLIPLVDGVNFDVKAYDSLTYEKLGGNLNTVKQIVEKFVSAGVHTEITYLVVPDFNDNNQIKDFLEWVADMSNDIPIHFSRYFPSYRAQSSPTPVATLLDCYDQATDYINHVYLGNLGREKYQTTYCWNCSEEVIKRSMFAIDVRLKNGKCPVCDSKIAGVF